MENNKKDFIVIICSCPFPFGNASDNAIYTFMAGFNEHGCEGEVVCLYPNLPCNYNCPSVGKYKGVNYRYLHKKVHRSKSKIINRVDVNFLSKFLLKRYLKRVAKSHRVTALFIAHVSDGYYSNTKYCHSLGIRTVLVSCEYPEYLIETTSERLIRFKELSSHTDKYIFETKTLEDYTKSALNKDIDSIVIPATMPFEDILQCQKTETNPYIAYCGSINSEEKDGLKSIIKAFSIFHNNFPGIMLKFIGRITKPSYHLQLKDLVNNLNLQDSVTFVGEVDRAEYVQYVTNSSLMIVAKPKDSYYGGGLSSKVIEYLFSGNPVLMTDSDDYVYYLTHKKNVYFVHDNNPETLADAMCILFNQQEKMKTIGENGRLYALDNFNYHKLTEGLLKFVLS